MICDKCEKKKTQLFTSWVCDACEEAETPTLFFGWVLWPDNAFEGSWYNLKIYQNNSLDLEEYAVLHRCSVRKVASQLQFDFKIEVKRLNWIDAPQYQTAYSFSVDQKDPGCSTAVYLWPQEQDD